MSVRNKHKVITVCGSLKFKKEIVETAVRLETAGNVALIPVFPDNEAVLTDEEINMLGKMHKEKIKLSDAVFIVNVNQYIGKSTKSEIDFAKELNKEILYYMQPQNNAV